jgi:hypothetical protein
MDNGSVRQVEDSATVTLSNFPEHPAAEYVDKYGARREMVNGQPHYVTTDDQGRAIVGPKQHRHRLRWGRVRPERRPAGGGEGGSIKAKVHVGVDMADPEATVLIVQGEEVPAPKKVTWRDRVRHGKHVWMARLYDKEWHEATRHLAVDIMMWSMGLSMSVIFIKGAWWVVSL